MEDWLVRVRLGKVPIDEAQADCLRTHGLDRGDWRFGANPTRTPVELRIPATSQAEAETQAIEQVKQAGAACGAPEIQPEVIDSRRAD